MSSVADVRQKKTTVDLGDGVEREVTLSLNALAELEEKYGTVEEAFNKVQQGSIAAIRYMLWCVLAVDSDQPMTELEVGRLIRLDNMGEIMSALMDAFEEQMPQTQGTADPNQQAPTKVVEMNTTGW